MSPMTMCASVYSVVPAGHGELMSKKFGALVPVALRTPAPQCESKKKGKPKILQGRPKALQKPPQNPPQV